MEGGRAMEGPEEGKSPLDKLQKIVEGKKQVLIVLHNNPDPDALAAAAALKYLFREKWGVPSTVAYGGIVGRSENQAMIRYLKLDIKPLSEVKFKQFPVLALVDTQPGAGNNSLPRGVQPTIVIDHHEPVRARTSRVKFADIRTDYGSTSTIVTEYLKEADIPGIDRRIITALFYGIKSDTRDLGRGAGGKDREAFVFLYPRVLFKTLSKIEHPQLPRDYFKTFEKAIDNSVIYKDALVCELGFIENPDVLAEMSDLLVRVEGIRWALSIGEFNGEVYFSLRTASPRGHSDWIVQKMVAKIGSGGGHHMAAAGKVSLSHPLVKDYRTAVDLLVARFLKRIRRENIPGKSL